MLIVDVISGCTSPLSVVSLSLSLSLFDGAFAFLLGIAAWEPSTQDLLAEKDKLAKYNTAHSSSVRWVMVGGRVS